MSTPVNINSNLNLVSGFLKDNWLSAVVANIPQAVLLENDDHVIQIANQQFCRLFQLEILPEELVGKKSSELFIDLSHLFDNPIQYSERIRTIIKQKEATNKEVVKLKDGRILLRDYIPLGQDNLITGHMWMFNEETERIKAEILLQEQQNFYEDILSSIPSDVAVFSPEHKYLYINPVGLKDPELRKWLIGKTDYDYCLKRGKDIAFAQQRRDIFIEIIESGKEKEWEERIVNKKGEVEYHLRKMSPIYDENKRLVWMIGYSVNITERKKFEEKVQLSEKRYRDLFNYSQAIICTHDLKGNFLSTNPSLLEVLGYEENEIIGKNLKDLLPSEDKDGFDDLYLKSILEDNNKIKGLFRILHKSGRIIYLLYQNYKVAESDNAEAYIIAFAQDVTDRIKAEKELKEAKKLTEEIARNKEMFLANMSHEIRTPMNGIIGITSFLQKSNLNEEQKNYLGIIQESANDLLTIINDILDLEKVGTGNIQLEKIPFDIVAKTNTIIKLFELTARNKGTNIIFENELGNSLCIVGDPTRYNQVLNNLISNAVKFTHQGNITIHTSVANETKENITLKVSVKDTGIGIDPNNLEKIFQPFTQAYPETTRKYGGTGLGLAITKNLLEVQGGKIWVDSLPKKGSTFNFSITYDKCKEGQDLLEKKVPLFNRLGELKILLAEDNEVNQLLTKGMLEYWGFKPKVASTGTHAMKLIEKENFDVILMDIQMPEKNGFETTKEIRALADTKKNTIPIIALTANALQGEEAKYYAAGMNGYLTKPFSESALYEMISHVIEQPTTFSNIEAVQQNTAMQTEPTQKLYDLTLVNELARGNEEFILNLSKIFIDTVPPTSKEMVSACEKKNWEQVGKLAHKLKSTIDTMCINSLKDDIRLIEKNGKDKTNIDAMPGLVEKADQVITKVTEQLKAEFKL
jgi:PAS domain S-box-containing protein